MKIRYYGAQSSYSVVGLPTNTVYSFYVVATNSFGNSPPSPTVSIDTTKPSTPPTPEVIVMSSSYVDLIWNQTSVSTSSSPVLQYYVGISINGSAYVEYNNGLSLAYTATGLPSGVVCSFYIAAANAFGRSPNSSIVSVTTTG
jgi:hypothetical protein